MPGPLDRVDHLVWAAPDLDAGIDAVEAMTGVRAAYGGRHPGLGTHNALAAIGPRRYLEIVAPDPSQREYRSPRWFGLDALDDPRLVTWAANGEDLESWSGKDLGGGSRLGEMRSGRRAAPDGTMLSWAFTDPYTVIADGVVPFLIDWGRSPHPADAAPGGLELRALVLRHPDAPRIERLLGTLGLALPVEPGSPGLAATLAAPGGLVELH